MPREALEMGRSAIVVCLLLALVAAVGVAQVPSSNHVFVLIEENHGYSQVVGSTVDMPYLNSLISKYGLATKFYGNQTGSIPDYFMATAGQALDTWSVQNINNIVRQLNAAGKSWKSYAESLPYTGYLDGKSYPYTREHNPFALFSDVVNSSAQKQNLVPFSPNFAQDLANNTLPNYSFIVPNLQNDAHDCPPGMSTCTDSQKLQNADQWLKKNIDPLIQSSVFQQDGLLIIEFDEGEGDTTNGGGHVAWVVIGPKVKPGYRSSYYYYANQSTLRLTCDALGIALSMCPGAGASAADMDEFFGPTGSVSGTVVDDQTHAPIAGAAISYSSGGAATDGDGNYSLPNVSPGAVVITATAPGYATSSATVTVAEGQNTNQNFFLTASATTSTTGTISGTVVDVNDGAGISGATVRYDGGSTTTDKSGNFTFSNVPSGTYSVSASASGYFTETNSVTVSGGPATSTTIQLPTGGILSGTVASSGAAVGGATVSISGGKVASTKTVTTNSSGAYYTSWVPVGTYTVTVTATGYATQTLSATVNTGATTTLNVSLTAGATPTGTIAGTVTDAAGAALAGASVSFSGGSTTTASDGTYSFSNVPAGSVSITASASGYNSSSATVSVSGGATATQNFTLAAASTGTGPGTISGRVVDISNGVGISGATVTFPGGSTVSGSGGAFSFSGVAPGTYSVTAKVSGYFAESTTVTVNSGATASATIQLPTGGIIAGTVTGMGGAAVGGATVTLTGGSVTNTVTVTANSSGAFNTGWVPVGTYNISVSAAGYDTQSATANASTGKTTTVSISLVAGTSGGSTGGTGDTGGTGGGGTTTGPATITGRVSDISNGGAVRGATVSYSGGSTTTDYYGNYTLSNVNAGTYSVTVVASGYFSRTMSVSTTAAGATSTLNIPLATGGKVAGTVTNASGAAISGATVTITGGSISTTVNTPTNSSGVYVSGWVPVGTYTVSVSASGYSTVSKQVNITTGQTSAVNFALP